MVAQLGPFLVERMKFVDRYGWELARLRREMIGAVVALAALVFVAGEIKGFEMVEGLLAIITTLVAIYALVVVIYDMLLLPIDSFDDA